MRQPATAAGLSRAGYGVQPEEEATPRSRLLGAAIKAAIGLFIAFDAAFLALPLYYGTFSPCSMVALGQSHLYSQAVDLEIGISDEIPRDTYFASQYYVRSQQSFASCAGEIGGRTASALLP